MKKDYRTEERPFKETNVENFVMLPLGIKYPYVRAQYNYDMDEASLQTALECKDATKTVQSSLEETDINTIVRRFALTGQLPTDIRPPQYGDFDEITDYHTALNRVRAAQTQFDRLPADLRARFQNDAGAFVDFCLDPNNQNELEALLKPSTPVIEAVAETQQPKDTPGQKA